MAELALLLLICCLLLLSLFVGLLYFVLVLNYAVLSGPTLYLVLQSSL